MPLALLAAIAASLVTHATVLFLPDGDWLPASQESHDETVTLHAELHLPSPVAGSSLPTKPNNPQGKTSKRPKPVPTTPSPALPTGSTTSVTAENTLPETAVTSAGMATTAAPALPPGGSQQGSLSYRVYKGTQGFEVGRAVHQWTIIDGHYTLSATTQTSGLAGLFYPITLELVSAGDFGPDGFVPNRFRTLKQGAETQENASFDWAQGRIQLDRDGKYRPLAQGSQDLLSFPFQLAYRVRQLGADETAFPMHVASGKRYDAFNFTVQGEESVDTRAGTFRTLHLKATAPSNSADTTDVWLAIEHQWLAIKIRFTDRHGDSFEQVVDSLQIQPEPVQEKP